MQWTDDTRIETPEQIDVSLELAGLGSRFVGRVVDWLLKGLLLMVLGAVVVVFLTLVSGVVRGESSLYLVVALVSLFYFFALGYDIYFEVRHNGQTPGKRLAGIRVIRESGAPVDFRSAAIRGLLGLADFLPAGYLFGGLLILATRRHQRLGDLAAGTLVIRERVEALPDDVEEAITHLATPEYTFTGTQLAACSSDDRNILRSFLQRYHELDIERRHQLACRLAEQYIRRLAYPVADPAGSGPRAERFLASLFRDLESAARQGR